MTTNAFRVAMKSLNFITNREAFSSARASLLKGSAIDIVCICAMMYQNENNFLLQTNFLIPSFFDPLTAIDVQILLTKEHLVLMMAMSKFQV